MDVFSYKPIIKGKGLSVEDSHCNAAYPTPVTVRSIWPPTNSNSITLLMPRFYALYIPNVYQLSIEIFAQKKKIFTLINRDAS